MHSDAVDRSVSVGSGRYCDGNRRLDNYGDKDEHDNADMDHCGKDENDVDYRQDVLVNNCYHHHCKQNPHSYFLCRHFLIF